MGWTYHYTPPTDERAEIIDLFHPHHVEYLTKRGSTWYVAATDPTTGETYAGIVMTARDGGQWGYKLIDETAYPYRFEAPAKLLDMLSPPFNDSAKRWRESCRLNAHARAKVRAIKDGDRIKLAEPLDFGTFREDTFRAVDWENYTRTGKTKRVYYAENARTHVRLTASNILSNGFEVLS